MFEHAFQKWWARKKIIKKYGTNRKSMIDIM